MTPRLMAVLVSGLMLQATVAPNLRLLGSTPLVLLLIGIVAGVVGGPERGAVVGFAAGVAMDMLVSSPFGLWALTTTLVGWAVGHLHGRAIAPGAIARAVTAALGTALGVVLFVVLGSLLGEDHLLDLPLGGLVGSLAVANMVLMPVAVRALRWAEAAPGVAP